MARRTGWSATSGWSAAPRWSAISSALVALFPAVLVSADDVPSVVVVQPILVSDDDGRGPAKIRIVERMIDRVYARAGVDFHFLEPIAYRSSAARDGKIHVNEIVEATKSSGLLRGDGRVINMLFVRAVNGKAAPNGLAQTPGSIVFIAQGDSSPLGQDAFVVAHESGHNLGLRHAVDDDRVPDDIPNLMGDGPYEDRVGVDGLTDYQVEIVRRSPLVRPRVECLDAQEGRYWIEDESFEPYFADMQLREIVTLTAEAIEGGLEQCRRTARERFSAAVRDFDDRERSAIEAIVGSLRGRLSDDWPLLVAQPWRFIKVANHLCGGFSHTRGLCIVFSERTVQRIVGLHEAGDEMNALVRVGPLFVHEQLHVLQRCYPERFARLYEDAFGMVRGHVVTTDELERRRIGNPDAPRSEWVVRETDASGVTRWFWPRTVIESDEAVPRMGRDFQALAVRVRETGPRRFEVVTGEDGKAVSTPLESEKAYRARLVSRRGIDHPNEIAAYALGRLLGVDHLGVEEREDHRELGAFRRWCREHLTTHARQRRRL